MQDLTTTFLVQGGLLVGYGSPLIAYLFLRRKARRTSAGRPIIQIQWWNSVCGFLCAGLLAGAIAWIIAIATLFAGLSYSLDDICPSLITQDECSRAKLHWDNICAGLIECGCAAIVFIMWMAHAAAKWTDSSPERTFPLILLTCSHCLFVASWLSCAPLNYSLEVFSIIGTKYWTAVSSAFAFLAILAYILGTTLWMLASISVFYAWRRRRRNRAPAQAPWPGEFERDLVLLEMYP